MTTTIAHSMRISEANRLAESYMKSTAKTRKIVMTMIEKGVERWSHGSLLTLDEQDAGDLKRLLIRTFTDGFTAGCRTVMALDR